MIAGRKYNQESIGTYKDGIWTVKVKIVEGTTEDLETWEDVSFESEAFGSSFEEAFNLVSQDVIAFLTDQLINKEQEKEGKDESGNPQGGEVQ